MATLPSVVQGEDNIGRVTEPIIINEEDSSNTTNCSTARLSFGTEIISKSKYVEVTKGTVSVFSRIVPRDVSIIWKMENKLV